MKQQATYALAAKLDDIYLDLLEPVKTALVEAQRYQRLDPDCGPEQRKKIGNRLVDAWTLCWEAIESRKKIFLRALDALESEQDRQIPNFGTLRQPFDSKADQFGENNYEKVQQCVESKHEHLVAAQECLRKVFPGILPRKRREGMLPWEGQSDEWEEMVNAIERQALLVDAQDHGGRASLHNLTVSELNFCRAQYRDEPTTENLLTFAARKLASYRNVPLEEVLSDEPLKHYESPQGVPITEAKLGVFLYLKWKRGDFGKTSINPESIGTRNVTDPTASVGGTHQEFKPANETIPTKTQHLGDPECSLAFKDDCWVATFDGRRIRLPDERAGFYYLRLLLENRDHPITAVDLQERRYGGKIVSDVSTPMIDETATKEYRKRLGEINTRLDENGIPDEEREVLENEREELESHLTNATWRGKTKPLKDLNDGARRAVSKSIESAIKYAKRIDEPLGMHLKSAVKVGATCIYRPNTGGVLHTEPGAANLA